MGTPCSMGEGETGSEAESWEISFAGRVCNDERGGERREERVKGGEGLVIRYRNIRLGESLVCMTECWFPRTSELGHGTTLRFVWTWESNQLDGHYPLPSPWSRP